MSNTEILEKAIQKALENGWDIFAERTTLDINHKGNWELKVGDFDDYQLCYWNNGKTKLYEMKDYEWPLETIIFNHDFAKALWGEREIAMRKDNDSQQNNKDVQVWDALYAWQYHLQQMVIADDPIKYLGEHI